MELVEKAPALAVVGHDVELVAFLENPLVVKNICVFQLLNLLELGKELFLEVFEVLLGLLDVLDR